MNVNIQIKFAPIFSALISETHTISDISTIITHIMDYKKVISDDAKKILLQIPRTVLCHQIEILNEGKWSVKNGSYFAGNTLHLPKYKTLFQSGQFSLEDLIKFFDCILSDNNLLNSGFELRNIEVTLRDDVIEKEYSNFKESGPIYADIMRKAFDL